MIFPNVNRIRKIIGDAKTEQDISILLRSHKIKYHFTTETGYMSIRIPCCKGCVRVYRVNSKAHPFVIYAES